MQKLSSARCVIVENMKSSWDLHERRRKTKNKKSIHVSRFEMRTSHRLIKQCNIDNISLEAWRWTNEIFLLKIFYEIWNFIPPCRHWQQETWTFSTFSLFVSENAERSKIPFDKYFPYEIHGNSISPFHIFHFARRRYLSLSFTQVLISFLLSHSLLFFPYFSVCCSLLGIFCWVWGDNVMEDKNHARHYISYSRIHSIFETPKEKANMKLLRLLCFMWNAITFIQFLVKFYFLFFFLYCTRISFSFGWYLTFKKKKKTRKKVLSSKLKLKITFMNFKIFN